MNKNQLKSIIRQQILQEYFMTKTKTRADLKKLPPKRDQYAALGSDVAGIIKILHKADETANNEVDLIKSKLDIDPGDFIISSDMKPQWIDNLYRDTFEKIGLHKLGNGVARDVFEINDEFVLKYEIATSSDRQNETEIRIIKSGVLGDFVPKIYASGEVNNESRWIICDRVVPLNFDSDALEWFKKTGILELYLLKEEYNREEHVELDEFFAIFDEVLDFLEFDDSEALELNKFKTFEEMEDIKALQKQKVELFKSNKFLQTILRAQKESSFNLEDLHAGNVGFAGQERRPVVLDAGF
jgi:hypothetical protein